MSELDNTAGRNDFPAREMRRVSERVTVGEEKVSVVIVVKTHGDLLVAQHSIERWFATPEESHQAVSTILGHLAGPDGFGDPVKPSATMKQHPLPS